MQRLREVNNFERINLRVLDPTIMEFSGFCPARVNNDKHGFKLV